MKFIDAAAVSGVKETSEGFLVADCYAVRTGIQLYAPHEVGRMCDGPVRVYRPETEVFKRDSLQSFSHVPVTIDHPVEAVTKDNWKDLAVGEASSDVIRDGERLRIPLVLKDKSAVAAFNAGKRELSAGYTCDLDFTPGVTADGQEYDAVQRNIRANHIALVDHGRAGSAFRFGDVAKAPSWGAAPLTQDMETPMNLKTIMHDGVSVQVTEQGAQIIDKLTAKLADAHATADAAKADHDKAIAAKDAELAKKDAEIDATKAKILSDGDLDKRVKDRGDLIAKAKAIVSNIVTDGLSDADIRKAVVKAKLGDAAIADKAPAYVDARFDILCEDASKGDDPALRAIIGDKNKPTPSVGDAHNNMITGLQDAWKAPVKGAA